MYPQDPASLSWIEMYVIACIVTQGVECIREFIDIDALSTWGKLVEMRENLWQLGDFFIVILCLVGASLRILDGYFEYGMVILRSSSIYWNLRLYKFLGVHRFVGPKIVMMFRMFSHMVISKDIIFRSKACCLLKHNYMFTVVCAQACFSMIIFVVIISFAMARESIRFPDVTPTFKDLALGFLEPYAIYIINNNPNKLCWNILINKSINSR